jgi:L-arabinose isomerase
MTSFKRVSLVGSEELFRPTRPQVVEGTDEVIKDAVDRPGAHPKEVVLKTLNFTPEEIELLVEAVQTAKYPDRPRAKPALDKFDALDALRLKIQEVAG